MAKELKYINVGGVDYNVGFSSNDYDDDAVENMNRLLQKIFPLTVKLEVSPTGTFEYSGNASDFLLSWNCTVDGVEVAPNSITSILLKNETTGETLPLATEPGDADYSAVRSVSVSNDTIFSMTVEAQGMTAGSSVKVNYAYRSYSGVVNSDFVVSETNIAALEQSKLVDGKTQSYSYDAFSLKKILFAYAKTYGALSDIKDANNVSLLANYTRSEIQVNGIPYYVYITSKEFSVSAKITYNYK